MLKKVAFVQLIIASAMLIFSIVAWWKGDAFKDGLAHTTSNVLGIVVLVVGIVFIIGAALQVVVGIFHRSILSVVAGVLVVLPIVGIFVAVLWWAAYVPILVVLLNLLVVLVGKK